ncbi:arginine repressor [Sphingomonas sp. KRR8]|uniref:arginine repressor n=1 Tax=Sphingomonas sp. KRR8 TaxID=2942996 RepID=UPI0020217ED1|nr:arginine repressor [Sphingomonas sp. KRR8]URD61590.1 arginine repressor [Sphingomonas sp. KRR8]
MNDVRTRRQRLIADLLRSRAVASQEALLAALREEGFSTTQATISRDLDQLGAVKLRRDGVTSYALPDEVSVANAPERRLRSILAEWVRSVEPVGQLVVIRTPPGSAHLVGVALDQSRLPEVAGTICGDDTIFIAARSPEEAQSLAKRLQG